jgi:predicted nucleotidyltransferase
MLPQLEYYLEKLARTLDDLLGDAVIGVYLHGSAAMGAFIPSRSDVDVLVVVRQQMSPSTKRAIAAHLAEDALPSPGVGLELSIVTLDSLIHLSEIPAFELHVDTHEERVLDGSDHAGDPDLIAHVAMARLRGIALRGPSPAELMPSIDRGLLLRTLAEDLSWAVRHGHATSAVLNACRALRFAREGVLSSKPEGGAWGLENRIGDLRVIRTALQRKSGGDERVALSEAAAFVEQVRRELLAKMEDTR